MNGQRVLVTGASGLVGGVVCRALAAANEVWGIARFPDPRRRTELEQLGVNTRRVDLASPDFDALPRQFDHVIHLAAYMEPGSNYDHAIRGSAEATGLLLSRYRTARSALVMSTTSVYAAQDDPWHLYAETDPLGAPTSPSMPTYPIAKIAEEAVARTCARMFDLPVIITRLNNLNGPSGGLALKHLKAMVAGDPIVVRADPITYSPVFELDVPAHLVRLLEAASVPVPIVNWGGDDAVSAQQWCGFFGELLGTAPRFEIRPLAGSQNGVAADCRRRRAITGPATPWRVAMQHLFDATISTAG